MLITLWKHDNSNLRQLPPEPLKGGGFILLKMNTLVQVENKNQLKKQT